MTPPRSRRRRALPLVAAALLVVAPLSPAAAEPRPGEPVFTFVDPAIVESSGLVARDGLVVTVNDSGDGNRIFTVDPATGRTVGTTTWPGEAVDIEALAPAGGGEVWVGDIGDNEAVRDGVVVTRVPFGRGDRKVEGTSYELAFPDGPHDAEALVVDPTSGRLFVAVKEFVGQLYAAPLRLDPDRPNELVRAGEVLGVATDAAFSPDGTHLVVRNYGQATVYAWPDLERVATLDLPVQPQGEGLTVREDGDLLISTEGAGTDVLRVVLPTGLQSVLAGDGTAVEPDPAAVDGATPSTGLDTDPVVVEGTPTWRWLFGGLLGILVIVVLLRALRPR